MIDNGSESLGDDGQDWEGDERHPTIAFGRTFTHIPEHVRQDLETLQRESVVYSDHWIEEVDDFRHVRIDFTLEERDEFARRSWAYDGGGCYAIRLLASTASVQADVCERWAMAPMLLRSTQ